MEERALLLAPIPYFYSRDVVLCLGLEKRKLRRRLGEEKGEVLGVEPSVFSGLCVRGKRESEQTDEWLRNEPIVQERTPSRHSLSRTRHSSGILLMSY